MNGRSPTIGLYYQSLITILEVLRDEQNWNELIIEPKDSTKIDIKIESKSPKIIQYYQVKVSEKTITLSKIKKWVKELKEPNGSKNVKLYKLILVGNSSADLKKYADEGIDNVRVPIPKNYDLDNLYSEAAHLIDKFIERKKPNIYVSASAKEEINRILISDFFESVIKSKTITRIDLENRLVGLISKFGTKQKDITLKTKIYDPLYRQVINEISKLHCSFFLNDGSYNGKNESFSSLIADFKGLIEWQRVNDDLQKACEKTLNQFGELFMLKCELIEQFRDLFKPSFILEMVPFSEEKISSIIYYFDKVTAEEWLARYFGIEEKELLVSIEEFVKIFKEYVIESEEYLQYVRKKEEIKQNLESIKNKILEITEINSNTKKRES